ncbi:acyl carrier protein [Kiloniella laminariae]|uniref:acyl carrier protein n=1 Tax=Kiloniella laminariae TaxID=454162 RepID=UPI000366EAB7|nr:acyl carrier protein [Kiloniella laminariae]
MTITTLERLKQVFTKTLEISGSNTLHILEYNKTPKWDSIGHMQLVAAIETEFDILMETEQIIDMSCFEKACLILGEHGIDCTS